MGIAATKPGKLQSDINVTPLVDIVLVLLIIFMVITPLLSKNLPIEVPQKQETEQPPEQIHDQMVLKLFADGHVELNKTTVTAEELPKLLGEKYASRTNKVLFFEGEDDAVYGFAVQLMDIAKGAGVQTLGMMTPDEAAAGAGAEAEAGLPGAVPVAPSAAAP
jgi:biopolymer transport protein ExbD